MGTAAQPKVWGSLLRKYGPTAAKLAGHAIKAYMSLAQTSATAVRKEKWLGMALKAAHMGYNLWKATRLAQTSAAAKELSWWSHAIKAATHAVKKYGPTAIKMAKAGYKAYNSAQTSAQKKHHKRALKRMFRKLRAARKAHNARKH